MSNDDYDDLSSLFVCESYVEKTFVFNEYEQKLLCSNMSSTDHDLTGQIVWPASILLSWYIYTERLSFRDKVVVELGAGCGLAGFFMKQFGKKVIITDGNEVVVRLLNKNKEHLYSTSYSNNNDNDNDTHNNTITHTHNDDDKSSIKYSNNQSNDNDESKSIYILPFLWGFKQEIRQLLDSTQSVPDIIIGADIILWPDSIPPLVHTLRWLLSCKPKSSYAIISYIVRAHTTTTLFIQTCKQYHLLVTILEASTFLPQPQPDNLINLDKRIFKIQISHDDDDNNNDNNNNSIVNANIHFDTEPESYVDNYDIHYATHSSAC